MAHKETHKRIDKMEPIAAAPAPKPSFFNKLKHPSQFSKPQLAIFVLVFAAIGYLIFHTFAAAPLLTSLQAEQMTPSGGTATSSGFMTNLTNNGSLTTPYLWTFNPGVDTSAGYFFADGKQLAKITGPGPYVLRLNSGMLTSGGHKLGHAWDTITGVHQTPPSAYAETITNGSGTGFITTVKNSMTINAPYIWAFDPGITTSNGYFYADGTQLTKVTGPGPYAIMLGGGDNSLLTAGSHQLGHAWDTTNGVHQTPPSAYAVTYNPGTSTSVSSSVISDSTASGGQAVKFGGGVTLTGTFSLPSQAASLIVMAHGELCSTSWPQMSVKIDGQSALTTSVSSSSWTAYTLNLTLNSGSHTLSITNTSSGSCLPNLYADVTNFFGPNIVSSPPTVSLSASPASVSSGQSSTLTWSSTNATSCTASGAWSGSKPTSGSVPTGALSQNSTYTLTCTGSGGSATASTTVNVAVSTATSYDQAIAYTQTRAPFTPLRTINVTSAAQLLSAISNLQPGDLVKATASFTVSGETVISKRLSSDAVIDLTGATVKFVYTGTSNLPSVWIKNASHIRIYGGDLSMTQPTIGGGTCLVWYGSQYITWWYGAIHDCGSGGMGITTAKPTSDGAWPQPIQHNDIQFKIYHFSLNHGLYDNHVEKCSGIHGTNIADSNYADQSYNRIAVDVEDSPCTGGGISFGSSQSTNIPDHTTIYLKCVSLTFVSITQTGGNCYQTWGHGNQYTDIKYLEADSIMGHAYWPGGLYNKPNSYLATDVIEYGRANTTDQNSRYAKDCTFNKEGNTVFQDILSVSPNQSSACYAPFTN